MSDPTTLDLVLTARERVADEVVLLTLAAAGGGTLPAWDPGAHIDLHLGGSPSPLVRQYSLCSSPSRSDVYQVAVLREPGGRGGSAYVHDRLRVGDRVSTSRPRNNFPLVDAERSLFIAGGIGITPILPMIEAVAAATRDWRLIYGGRTARSMAFTEQLSAFGTDRVDIRPQDVFGLLDLDTVFAELEPGTVVYCCGPAPLLAAVEARAASLPRDTVRFERFAPREGVPDTAPLPFDVELASRGEIVHVPADRSILDVLEEAGVPLVYSCMEGTCGSCETAVIAGEPDHRDSVLSDGERESGRTIMICVSRARGGKLVLDV
jgi:ferredoxin-NADP reductase